MDAPGELPDVPPTPSHTCAVVASGLLLGVWIIVTLGATQIAGPLAELVVRVELALGLIDVRVVASPPEASASVATPPASNRPAATPPAVRGSAATPPAASGPGAKP